MFQHELRNDYIGEYKGWAPGSNTVAYYKFDGNMNDSSGNNRNLSVAQGTFTYGTLSQGAKYIQTNFNSYSSQISSFPLNSNSATISFWMSFANGTAGNGNTSLTYGATVFDLLGSNTLIRPVLSWLYNNYYLRYGFGYLDVVTPTEYYVPSVSESWHLYTAVLNGGTSKIYIDGVLRKTGTYPVQNGYSFRLNTVDGDSTQRRDYSSRDKLSELIFENRQWTAQEVQNYYNETKSNYIEGAYEYSYDFRNKTVSQIQSEGWVTREGSYSAGSSGIYTSVETVIGFPVNCSNAKKITMTGTVNASNTRDCGFNIGLMTTVTTQTSDAGIGLFGSGNNPSGAVTVYSNGSRSSGNDIGVIRPGTYTATVVIDLLNNSIGGNVPNKGTSTLSLTDAQVSEIRNMKGFNIYLHNGNAYTVTLSDVSIIIEY